MVDDDTAWAQVSACVGAPFCARARIDTTAIATALVPPAAPLPRTHVSGCERRCGAPTGDHVDLVAPTCRRERRLRAVGGAARARRRPTRRYDYLDDPTAIYRASFATIRAEADLSKVPADAEKVVVRMIHASGDPGLVSDVEAHPLLVSSAQSALRAGAPIFTDAEMIASGVTRRRLPGRQPGPLPAARSAGHRAGHPVGNHPVGGRGVLVG